MNKIRLLLLFFILCFIAIIIRLFYIQILSPGSYTLNYTKTNRIAPHRGKILDRNHEPIALNQTKYRLYIEPKKISDLTKLVHTLNSTLQIDEASLEARIDMSKNWVAIHGNVDKEKRVEIEKYNFTEIGFENIQQRYYPEASLAAHLVGFLGKDINGDPMGYFGIEGFYNKDLSGFPGVVTSDRDLLGRPIFSGKQDFVEAEDGRDVVLTIDKSIQHIIKNHLRIGIDKYKANSGCVIAVDPYTMEILGLACLPDFDPETYYQYQENIFSNWSISSSYEPGSTFKPLIMAAAIEEREVKVDGFFNEDGPITIGNYTIRNWNDKYEGKISIPRILEKSSNVGMVYLGSKLGKVKLYDYLNKYGFGSSTQIDLQGESTGDVKAIDKWYPIDEATMAFGQGISVTGLQLVRSFASIINGGLIMRPYVVKEVIEGKKIKIREPQIQRRVISEKTSDIMRNILASVVSNAEMRWKMPKGYSFGGKTGTAQIAVKGKYDFSKTIASFIGFVPVDKPAFLILVVLQEPEVSSWGSETAAPIFFQIAQDLLLYMNIQPN